MFRLYYARPRRSQASAGKAGFNQRIRVVKLGAGALHETAAVGEESEVIADMADESGPPTNDQAKKAGQ